jgi:hypothetical protein
MTGRARIGLIAVAATAAVLAGAWAVHRASAAWHAQDAAWRERERIALEAAGVAVRRAETAEALVAQLEVAAARVPGLEHQLAAVRARAGTVRVAARTVIDSSEVSAVGAPVLECPSVESAPPVRVPCPEPVFGCAVEMFELRTEHGVLAPVGTLELRWRWPGAESWTRRVETLSPANTHSTIAAPATAAPELRHALGIKLGTARAWEVAYSRLVTRRVAVDLALASIAGDTAVLGGVSVRW